jgi:hypothetical protein
MAEVMRKVVPLKRKYVEINDPELGRLRIDQDGIMGKEDGKIEESKAMMLRSRYRGKISVLPPDPEKKAKSGKNSKKTDDEGSES